MTVVERAWGFYKVLDVGSGWTVKELEFNESKALSDQRHTYRSEHWHVVKGNILSEKISLGAGTPSAYKKIRNA